jgi:hypothetical protein
MVSGPRRFNWVSLVLLAGVAGGGYWLWKFFPVYYTNWQVDHALAEAVSETYRIAHQGEPGLSAAKLEIESTTRAKVVALGVDDPEMALRLDIDAASQTATALCEYTVVVRHDWFKKQSVMHFRRAQSTSIKRIDW